MKVKFNLPKKSYNSKLSFDNNTTFGFGNVQPLFSKFVVPHSKLTINFGQLTRLAPLVVPSFARLKQLNDFVFVPMNKVFPAFDAYLSRNMIKGTTKSYVPNSVPCITNRRLFNLLVGNYSYLILKRDVSANWEKFHNSPKFTDPLFGVYTGKLIDFNFPSDVSQVTWDFEFFNGGAWEEWPKMTVRARLTQAGRYWYSVLKGLGYSVDPTDDKPVSVLPLLAFIKAYYDCYYVKRYNSWHSSQIYSQINGFYNGTFVEKVIDGHTYQLYMYDPLVSLFEGTSHDFYMYASADDSPLQVALSSPINTDYSTLGDNGDTSAFGSSSGASNVYASTQAYRDSPLVLSNTTQAGQMFISAESLSLVDRLWHFMSRSSVVGQSVKDWFKVHFGVSPSEDMFDTCTLFASKPNIININSVIATADGNNGTTSSRLGDLAGQAFASQNDVVKFTCPSFGFVFCMSAIIPLTRVSGGTQPELYNTSYFDFAFPDFDGLGYEVVNQSSLGESGFKGDFVSPLHKLDKGFGWLPRLSSYKFLNNFRSGGFAIPSVIDSYLSYCEDTVFDNSKNETSPVPSPTNLKLNYPWRYNNVNFVSYDRIFYNQFTPSDTFTPGFLDDNFMCQTAFDVNVTSYLKPLSDSYSIESLGKQVLSVKAQ